MLDSGCESESVSYFSRTLGWSDVLILYIWYCISSLCVGLSVGTSVSHHLLIKVSHFNMINETVSIIPLLVQKQDAELYSIWLHYLYVKLNTWLESYTSISFKQNINVILKSLVVAYWNSKTVIWAPYCHTNTTKRHFPSICSAFWSNLSNLCTNVKLRDIPHGAETRNSPQLSGNWNWGALNPTPLNYL